MRFIGNTTTSKRLLRLIKKIATHESKAHKHPAPIEVQVFLMFCNRMLIDAESALLLAKKGYYGPAYSLIAVSLRNMNMYASLLSDKSRFKKFWDEDKDTFQVDKKFKKLFNEGESARTAKSYLGDDAFNPTEFDKLLHGSCFAIRKYYSKKQVTKEGVRYPVLMMGSFYEESKKRSVQSLTEGFMTDFLGIFFTDYKDSGRNDLEEEIKDYFNIADEMILKTQKETRDYVSSEVNRHNQKNL